MMKGMRMGNKYKKRVIEEIKTKNNIRLKKVQIYMEHDSIGLSNLGPVTFFVNGVEVMHYKYTCKNGIEKLVITHDNTKYEKPKFN
jgi:hypothetical protein